jgi:general secretion pathway protein D
MIFPQPEKRFSHWLMITFVLALLAVVGDEPSAWGQTRALKLQKLRIAHLSPAAAAVELQTAVRRQRLAAEVFLDRRDSTLVVQTDAETFPLVERLWQIIDQPRLTPQHTEPGTILPVANWQDTTPMSHVLQNIAPQDLERALLTVWPRLHFQPEGNGDVISARLPGEAPAVIRLDGRTRSVQLTGAEDVVSPWRKVISALDAPAQREEQSQILPFEKADPRKVAHAMQLLGQTRQNVAGKLRPLEFVAQNQPAPLPEDPQRKPPEAGAAGNDEEGPIGPVTIEILEGLDVIIVRGKKRDVERVQRIIADIERQSQQTTPEIEVHPLQHIDGRAVSDLIAQIYEQAFAARQSRVSITPLIKPNALLLIGQKESVAALKELINKLDQPVPPQSQLKVIPLKHISAVDAERTVRAFFVQRPGSGTDERMGLGTRVNVVADARSNVLIVQASARDMLELTTLLQRLDVEKSAATQEVRIFRLKNALAEELAPVLQEAISGQRTGGTGTGGAANAGATSTTTARTNTNLQLLQLDGEGRRTLESGILSNVKVTADSRGNALIVTGPKESMDLIGMLIQQLDELPAAEASIKVFTLVNGEAQTIVTALQQLFGQATGGGQGQLPQQTATGGGDSTLVPLRFTVDQRTNSVIASGSRGDLEVVERLLIRLDEGDVRKRKTTVYRLRNAPALDVSTAINQFLTNQRQVNQLAPTLVSQTEQIEREVIVVPERVSNSLLVSATPRYFEEIQKIVEDLDKRPPMVMIQVLIAEVTLDNLDEFGVELGLQDSLLFDRGIGTGATNTVGFPFNNQPLGNNNNATSLATRGNVGTQGLSHFTLGRTNSTLGYGGLVLSASSDSVNMLLRALQRSQRLQVVSRPQVQTLDNQPAFVQVGARVPRITNSTPNQLGQVTNSTELINVGILLGVTPRTSPDGLIVMEINAEKSEVGPEATGIPIFVNNNGDVIRSPQIFITTAQTTVSARTGQTVILGGLITKNRSQETRRVPYLSDVPVLGRLFRYDLQTEKKTELLIIMTPYVMRSDEDLDAINARETERMNWCLSDVVDVHGELFGNGLPENASNTWSEKTTPVIFPDQDPTGSAAQPTTKVQEPRTQESLPLVEPLPAQPAVNDGSQYRLAPPPVHVEANAPQEYASTPRLELGRAQPTSLAR